MSDLVAVTAVYGSHHIPFAKVLVESLHRVGISRDDIVVMTADVPAEFKAWLHTRSSNIPIRQSEQLDGERSKKVARKLVAWTEALGAAVNDEERVAFLDADTMVHKPLYPAFDSPFDVAYTIRPGRWPVNSGVVFARVSPAVRTFFDDWRVRSERIVSDPDRNSKAVGEHGAADQAALLDVIDSRHDMLFRAVSCDVWNDDTCAHARAAVSHFKGCLPLLLRERPYGPEYGDERKPEECEPVFEKWRSVFQGIEEIA